MLEITGNQLVATRLLLQ